jgi:hypothetical protein
MPNLRLKAKEIKPAMEKRKKSYLEKYSKWSSTMKIVNYTFDFHGKMPS